MPALSPYCRSRIVPRSSCAYADLSISSTYASSFRETLLSHEGVPLHSLIALLACELPLQTKRFSREPRLALPSEILRWRALLQQSNLLQGAVEGLPSITPPARRVLHRSATP